ncbi:MAG: TraB/GumN family protein [Flavobacteriales bacterium]
MKHALFQDLYYFYPMHSIQRSYPLLLILLLGSSALSFAQKEEKPYQGLLWKITGNGVSEPSYLYGTMHVSDKLAYHLNEKFFQGIRNCDAIALENSPSLWMKEIMGKDRYPSYWDLMSDRILWSKNRKRSFYEDAFHISRPDKELLSQALSEDNRLIRKLLFRRDPRKSGNFEESTYLDLFIFRAGKKEGKKVHSLESFDVSNRMRFKAKKIAEENDDPIMDHQVFFDGEEQNVQELTRKAYRQGDLYKLDSVMKLAASDAFYRYMLVKRNRIMANNLDSLLQKKSVFTGIGAAHLAGDSGVIEKLRKKGYELEPLERNFNKKSSKSKEAKKRIEETYAEQEFALRYPDDSLFQVALPGPLYKTRDLPNSTTYIYPDMVNGIFYQVKRINTYGPLLGHDLSFQKRRIDSLIFENIPGEIQERKELRMNGYPAFHIKNKTVRGDIQEYRIVITPLQLLIFKAGGTGEILEGKASKAFFDSLKLRKRADSSWQTYIPEHGGFKVDLPGTPQVYDPPTTDIEKEARFRAQARDPSTGDYYLLMKRTLHDHDYIEEDSFELKRLASKFAEPLGLEVKKEERNFVPFRGYPGLRVVLKSDDTDRKIRMRIVIRGASYYLLLASMKSDQAPDRFMERFAFQEPKYQRSFRTYHDTALSFKTRTIVPDSVPKNSLDAYRRRFHRMNAKDEDSDRWFEKKSKVFGTYKPADQIHVERIDMKEFAWVEDTAHLWDGSFRNLFEKDMVLKRRWRPEGKDSSEVHYLVGDTNSRRVIRSRNIYYKGAIFSIQHYTDTMIGESPYVDRFFSNFTPHQDSGFGPTVFDDKHDRFFKAMRSGDSARVARAMDQFFLLPFDEKHLDSLMHFLRDHSFNEQSRDLKAKALERLGWHYEEREEVIPFLRKMYKKEEGNDKMRFAILDALAHREDLASKRSILELMDQQVPLTSNEDRISDLFEELDDSLALDTPMVPEILKYTEFPKYKPFIYDLVGEMVDSGMVDGDLYRSFKPGILRLGKRQLRMYQASEKKESDKEEVSFQHNGHSYSYSAGEQELGENEEKILDLASLLAPFYETDPEVRSFFESLHRSASDALLFHESLLRIRYGFKVKDSLLTHFAANDHFRNELYRRLDRLGKGARFPEEFRDQKLFARSELVTYRNSANDSLRFLERRKVNVSGKAGYVYFFKSKKSYVDEWSLDYTGLQPMNEDRLDPDPMFTESGNATLNERQDLSELLDEQVDEIKVRERERVSSGSSLF